MIINQKKKKNPISSPDKQLRRYHSYSHNEKRKAEQTGNQQLFLGPSEN